MQHRLFYNFVLKLLNWVETDKFMVSHYLIGHLGQLLRRPSTPRLRLSPRINHELFNFMYSTERDERFPPPSLVSSWAKPHSSTPQHGHVCKPAPWPSVPQGEHAWHHLALRRAAVPVCGTHLYSPAQGHQRHACPRHFCDKKVRADRCA